jgi:hypothetical protein
MMDGELSERSSGLPRNKRMLSLCEIESIFIFCLGGLKEPYITRDQEYSVACTPPSSVRLIEPNSAEPLLY